MLSFVAKAFRVVNVIICWLIIIGVPIGATTILGAMMGGGFAVLGFLLGGIVGLIVVILFGGLIANFLSMVDDLEAIRTYLSIRGNSSRGNSSGGNLSGANLSNIQPVGPSVVNSGETWTYKKCGEKNPTTSSTCKGCGEYR